jgi:hypothetical protein
MPTRERPPPLGSYDHFEVISALRKSIKLGLAEQAIYWLTVILEFGGKPARKIVAKQLWIVANEDVDDQRITLRAFAVHQMSGVVEETDDLYFLTAAMCSARKWWQHPDGQLVDYWWSKALGDLRRAPREIPTWALDRHTRRGWQRLRSGEGFDDRFSGSDVGRMKTLWLYLRHGRLHPDMHVDEEAFRAFWQQRRDLEARGPRDVDEPAEFPPPPCLEDTALAEEEPS